MDSAELRAVQQPLKDAYREDPEKAVVTLRAHGKLDDAISCSVETGRALATAGLHPASGGDGSLLCSGDMLLQALVACAGVTLRAVATSLQITLAGGTVTAEGDLDFRGTLAVSKDAPVGFRSIRLAFDLDTDASAEQVQTLLRLTERYCVVYQTLAHPAELTISALPAGDMRGNATGGQMMPPWLWLWLIGDLAVLIPAEVSNERHQIALYTGSAVTDGAATDSAGQPPAGLLPRLPGRPA